MQSTQWIRQEQELHVFDQAQVGCYITSKTWPNFIFKTHSFVLLWRYIFHKMKLQLVFRCGKYAYNTLEENMGTLQWLLYSEALVKRYDFNNWSKQPFALTGSTIFYEPLGFSLIMFSEGKKKKIWFGLCEHTLILSACLGEHSQSTQAWGALSEHSGLVSFQVLFKPYTDGCKDRIWKQKGKRGDQTGCGFHGNPQSLKLSNMK